MSKTLGAMMSMRGVSAGAAAGVFLTLAGASYAGDNEECAAAYGQTQTARDKGKLIEARRQARACSASICAAFIVKECVQWLTEIEASLPTVVFAAQDVSGADTLKVRVWADGQVLTEALDGKAVPLDPGPHKLRFETAGALAIESDVVIRQGEKDRRIAVSFSKDEAPPSPTTGGLPDVTPLAVSPPLPRSGGVPVWAWVTGSLGLAFTGVAIGVGVDGLNAVSRLKKGCASSDPAVCTPMPPGSYTPDADNARKDRDLALAIGFGAAGAAGIGAAVGGMVSGTRPTSGGVRLLPIVGTSVRGLCMSGTW